MKKFTTFILLTSLFSFSLIASAAPQKTFLELSPEEVKKEKHTLQFFLKKTTHSAPFIVRKAATWTGPNEKLALAVDLKDPHLAKASKSEDEYWKIPGCSVIWPNQSKIKVGDKVLLEQVFGAGRKFEIIRRTSFDAKVFQKSFELKDLETGQILWLSCYGGGGLREGYKGSKEEQTHLHILDVLRDYGITVQASAPAPKPISENSTMLDLIKAAGEKPSAQSPTDTIPGNDHWDRE